MTLPSPSTTLPAIRLVHCLPEGDGVPIGFRSSEAGVVELSTEGTETWLCSPLRVLARFRDALGTGWGRIVEVTDADGTVHGEAILDADIVSSWGRVLRQLVGVGLRVDSAPTSKNKLRDFLLNSTPAKTQVSTERTGWVDAEKTAFVLGDGKGIGSLDVVPVNFNASSIAKEVIDAGTAEQWRDAIGTKCSQNDILLLSVSTALSGPLMDYLDLDLGGGLHLKGGSSQGKSTALRVATSVWGSPKMSSTWRATTNGLEVLAGSLNGTFLALDELGEVEGKQLKDAVYGLCNGTGKTRMNSRQEAGLSRRWRLAVLSTGELSIARKLAEAGQKHMDGQKVRLLDITADAQRYGAFDELHGAPDAATFSDRLKRATAAHYGSVGPAFVKTLIEKSSEDYRNKLRGMHDRFCAQILAGARSPVSGLERRAAERFALIALAGELATQWGLTGWTTLEALRAAIQVFSAWREAEIDGPRDLAEAVIEKLCVYVTANAGRVAEIDGEVVDQTDAVAWRSGPYLLFPASTWQTIFPDAAGRDAARALRDAGVLREGDGVNLMRKVLHPIHGRQRYYTIREDRLTI